MNKRDKQLWDRFSKMTQDERIEYLRTRLLISIDTTENEISRAQLSKVFLESLKINESDDENDPLQGAIRVMEIVPKEVKFKVKSKPN